MRFPPAKESIGFHCGKTAAFFALETHKIMAVTCVTTMLKRNVDSRFHE
jgi:hypothetical protein